MEAPVEIRYSGVILGRINEMPNAGEAAPFFLPINSHFTCVDERLRLASSARRAGKLQQLP